MYNDNIIYLSRLFWYFQVLGHFWARIMSMHHFSRFLSSPRLLPELLEVAKWGSKPVSCFFFSGWYAYLTPNVRCGHSAGNDSVLTIFSRWTIAHCFWFCPRMCQFCSVQSPKFGSFHMQICIFLRIFIILRIILKLV